MILLFPSDTVFDAIVELQRGLFCIEYYERRSFLPRGSFKQCVGIYRSQIIQQVLLDAPGLPVEFSRVFNQRTDAIYTVKPRPFLESGLRGGAEQE